MEVNFRFLSLVSACATIKHLGVNLRFFLICLIITVILYKKIK